VENDEVEGVLLTVGPVAGAAARSWTEHLLQNLAVVRERQHLLPFRLPKEVADDFEELLAAWRAAAMGKETFVWSTEMDEQQIVRLVRYWANLDALTDAQVRRLGLDWSPAEARPFYAAVAAAVAVALEQRGEPDAFAGFLVKNGSRPPRSAYVGFAGALEPV